MVRCQVCQAGTVRRSRCPLCRLMACTFCRPNHDWPCWRCRRPRTYANRPNHNRHDCLAAVCGLWVYGRRMVQGEPSCERRSHGRRGGSRPGTAFGAYQGFIRE